MWFKLQNMLLLTAMASCRCFVWLFWMLNIFPSIIWRNDKADMDCHYESIDQPIKTPCHIILLGIPYIFKINIFFCRRKMIRFLILCSVWSESIFINAQDHIESFINHVTLAFAAFPIIGNFVSVFYVSCVYPWRWLLAFKCYLTRL